MLAAAVPELVRSIANPPCVNPDTGQRDPQQPASPSEPCLVPDSQREFKPVVDIHIGIVTSSLGGLQNGCDTSKPNNDKVGLNDRGRLVSRLDKNGTTFAETYLDKGFLAWDPTQQKQGEADLDSDTGKDANSTALIPTLTDMVKGVSQFGCGYEATLEASYRFLNDPNPPANIVLEGSSAVPQGVDDVLLAQRRDFLRPDSLLAVIALSDENDCSIRSQGQFFIAGKTDGSFHLPPARSACATNPNDECCFSCGQADNANCTPKASDPACTTPDPADSDVRDSINLRCFDQKRRFGIDFLYPIERYTEAFSSALVTAADGSQLPNPIFSDLNPDDGFNQVRDASLVVFAGIVGVPWQDLARDPADLSKGLKNAEELSVQAPDGSSGWGLILGDPSNYLEALDPLMRETFEERVGIHPITGQPVADPSSFQANAINGNDYPIPNRDDLQYACIFALPQLRDCTDPANQQSCDCPITNDPGDQTSKPLCDPDPTQDHLQTHAKAYPGKRFLSVIRSLGAQGVVGSVCPKQLFNPDAPDFGYRPAMQAVLERMKTRLVKE